MTPKRPYLFRAMYDWILDNQLTPYIVVDTTVPEVQVPPSYVQEDRITLNLSPLAVTGFAMNNEGLEFKASFGGRLIHLYIPMDSIIVIYALENNHCLVFSPHEIHKGIIVNMTEGPEDIGDESGDSGDQGAGGATSPRKGPPKLTVVK
ncbi:MAG: ClpXP protease specificity-enhancing factor [Proteobacteria bacterium]|nr:ClpXP protease specificity-enhancing factor [Pseudomonadota bacterium]